MPRVVVIQTSDLGAALLAVQAYPQVAFESYAITTQFWGGDSITMNVNGAASGAASLVADDAHFLWCPDDGNALFLIEHIETLKTGGSRGAAELVVSGRSVDSFAHDERIVIPSGDYDTQTAVPAETAMKHYVTAHAGSGAAADRQIPSLTVVGDSARGAGVTVSARYQALADVLLSIGLQGPLGWSSYLDPTTGLIMWDVIVPTDRSASVFFDFDFGTISQWQDIQDHLASDTLVVVGGQGVLSARDISSQYQGSDPTGFARREAFLDATDVTLGDTATLAARGQAFLTANAPTRVNAATIAQLGAFQPGRDFYLGDIVLLRDLDLAVNESDRVVKLVKTYDQSAAVPTYAVSVGKPFPAAPSSSSSAPATGVTDILLTTPAIVAGDIATAVAALSAGGGNLVVNSSFEQATMTGAWTVGANWTAPYTSNGFHGTSDARTQLAAQTAGDLATVPIPVVRTDDYWLSFWSYLSAYTSGTARFTVREYSAANALLASTNVDLSAAETLWTRHSVHFGTDASTPGRHAFNASTAYIILVANSAGANATLTWEVDAFQVERGQIITAYAPKPSELADKQVGTVSIQDGAINADKLAAGSVVAGKIAAGIITADLLAATLVLASLIKTANSGARVELDAAGMRAYDGSGNLLVNIPTDGSSVYINAQVVATTLSVTGNAALHGTANELAAAAVLQLDSYQGNPTQAPTLVQSVPTVSMPFDGTLEPGGAAAGYYRSGLEYSATGGAGGATKVFYTCSLNTGNSGSFYLLELKASDLTVNRSVLLNFYPIAAVSTKQVMTVARLGTVIYVASQPSNDAQYGADLSYVIAPWVSTVTASTFAKVSDQTYDLIAGPETTVFVLTLHGCNRVGLWWAPPFTGDSSLGDYSVAGGNLTAAAMQADFRAVVGGDAAMTVTGTTNTGPFTFTFVNAKVRQRVPTFWENGTGGTATFAYSRYGGWDTPPAIASDGTNLWLVGADSTGQVQFAKYSSSMVISGSIIATSTNVGGAIFDAVASNADLGAARIISLSNQSLGGVSTWTTAGVYQTNESFPMRSIIAAVGGLTYGDAAGDGARFWGFTDGDGTLLEKFTTWTWTTASATYWVAYSWYDSNATGGTHETQVGPRQSRFMNRRHALTVTAQAIPGGGGTNDPNGIRVYMKPNATDPGLTALKLQDTPAAGVVTDTLVTYNSGGAADPGSNGFSTVAVPATLESQTAGWALKGDGTASFQGIELNQDTTHSILPGTAVNALAITDSDAAIVQPAVVCILEGLAASTQSIPNASANTAVTFNGTTEETADPYAMHEGVTNPTRITLPLTGRWLLVGHITWAGNTTGTRRIVDIDLNGSEIVVTEQTYIVASFASSIHSQTTHIGQFTAGDYVELMASHNATGAVNIGDGTSRASFAAYFLGV